MRPTVGYVVRTKAGGRVLLTFCDSAAGAERRVAEAKRAGCRAVYWEL